MRRVSFRVLLVIMVAVAVWGTLLVVSTSKNATVLTVERHMNMNTNQSDLKSRDCYITALNAEKKQVSGYAPSSFCTSVKKGDTVVIENGFVVRKY